MLCALRNSGCSLSARRRTGHLSEDRCVKFVLHIPHCCECRCVFAACCCCLSKGCGVAAMLRLAESIVLEVAHPVSVRRAGHVK